jgi:hypothetical protein
MVWIHFAVQSLMPFRVSGNRAGWLLHGQAGPVYCAIIAVPGLQSATLARGVMSVRSS